MYEKFVELLQERNITPYRVAMDTGVTQTTLSDWKVGRATPKTATLQKIADYFNVSVDWLTGKSQFRNNNEIGEYYSGWGNYDPYFEPPFDFAKLLISEREEQGVSVEQMANVIGVTAEQYTEIEDGALPINYDQGEKLCAFLGTNVVQVLFDNELYSEEVPEEYHDDVQKWIRMKELIDNEAMCSVDSNITTNQEYNIIKKYRTLDEYGKKVVNSVIDIEYERCQADDIDRSEIIELSIHYDPVSAGLGDELADYENWDKISVHLTEESRKADFILIVDGDSMEPKYHNGDYILVKNQPAVYMGEIGIFDVNGKGYIKKFGGDKLISINPAYENINIADEGIDFRCFGRVLGTAEVVK